MITKHPLDPQDAITMAKLRSIPLPPIPGGQRANRK